MGKKTDETVVVLSTMDRVTFDLAKSALDEAGIPYMVKGEGGYGLAAYGLYYANMPRSIIVAKEDAAKANEILEPLKASPAEGKESEQG